MTDIERVTQQIKDEIRVDKQGKGFISIRGAARLADVDHAYLVTSFKGGGISHSKLVQQLIVQGFKPGDFSELGIPDIALSVILGYYAMDAGKRCTEQAKLAYKAFSAIGIRVWMQQIKGYQQQSIAPQKTKLPGSLLNLIARIEKRGEELHTAHHRLMTDVRELVEVVRTTYNQDAREELLGLLQLAADQIEKAIAVPQSPKLIEQAFIMNSTQTGCLERYTSPRKNKAGEIVIYPKINASCRDKSIDEDWNWRYKYYVKDLVTGKQRNRNKSVPLRKLPAVRAAIALDATLPTILRLIEE